MENFINVMADLCKPEGHVGIGLHMPRAEFLLNLDLIGAILNKEVLLKGGNILLVGDRYYTNIRLAEK